LNSGSLYIGTSGFSHDPWAQGLFYPKDLPRKEWLRFYASHFNSVELNLTFQKVPEKDAFVEWQAQVPKDFRFSLKGFQYITHVKKLKGVSEPLRLFMDRVLKLKENLACVLWEIPPLGPDRKKLFEGFLSHLKKYPQAHHAFDLKDLSFVSPEVMDQVLKNKMSIVEPEGGKDLGDFPFRYFRSHGEKIEDIQRKMEKALAAGEDCYAYFTDDAQGKAIQDARSLLHMFKK